MNKMVERVIEAISNADNYCWRRKEISPNKTAYEIFKRDVKGNLIEWVKTYFTHDEAYEKVIELNNEVVARAAIEAMKEPTDKMIEVAFHDYMSLEKQKAPWNAKRAYNLMIQAALDDV